MIRRWARFTIESMATPVRTAALVGAVATPCLSAQEVELRWKFEPGADRVYRQIQTTRSSGAPMGESSQTQTSMLRQQVMSVADDGAADVRVTYESIQMVQEGPMGRQEFDSESGEAPADPMAMMLSQLVGVSFEITVAPDGEVRRVAGIESMVEAITKGVAGESPETAAMIGPMLEAMFTEESMRSMMQQGTQTLPDGPVAAGATWRDTSSIELPFGTLRSDTDYTLQEIAAEQGRSVARIGMRGTTGDMEPNADNPMAAGMSMSGGEMTGQIDFDVDRGLVLRSTFTMNMDVSAAGQSMRTESTVEMTLVEG